MNDILVLTCPYILTKDAMKKAHDRFLKQKESGVVILEAGWKAEVVPDDVQIVVKDHETLKKESIRDCGTCSLRSVDASNEPCVSCLGAEDENGRRTLPNWKKNLKSVISSNPVYRI